jgi:hypothetical protein
VHSDKFMTLKTTLEIEAPVVVGVREEAALPLFCSLQGRERRACWNLEEGLELKGRITRRLTEKVCEGGGDCKD